MKRRLTLVALMLAMLATNEQSEAHYFWVQPNSYRVVSKKQIAVRLFVGHATKLREGQYVRPAFRRFTAIGPRKTVSIRGKLYDKPAGHVILTGRGVHILVYESHPVSARIDVPVFEKYLREKGLDAVLAERARRGETKREGNESYERHCKALVRVGNSSRGYNKRVRLALELTPIDNPFRAGRKVRFVLELNGRPLAGAKVELVPLDKRSKNAIASARTDAKGRVRFKLPYAGRWMVSSIFMKRAKKPISGDWHSFWANLTFEAR